MLTTKLTLDYIVTGHFARGEEIPIAGFHELHDAERFLTIKLADNHTETQKRIYRLYEDSELMREFNPEQISVAYADFASGLRQFKFPLHLEFSVMVKPVTSFERRLLAQFSNQEDAKRFITSKCHTDSFVRDTDVFFIMQGEVLLDTFNVLTLLAQEAKRDRAIRNDGTAIFSPTPLSTRHVLPGSPQKIWIEKDEDE